MSDHPNQLINCYVTPLPYSTVSDELTDGLPRLTIGEVSVEQ